MNVPKATTSHVEHPEHEAVLSSVVALAGLFSNTVEAFGLIHSAQRPDKHEQTLLARLGLQQARLLIWGHALGICSPPASITNSAVPKNPSAYYPDLTEPTFFNARDPRLDDPATRTAIEKLLSNIVDCSASLTREQMMAQYGLRAPKRPPLHREPALDPHRLEAFRERHDLLCEVAASYAHIHAAPRASSIVHTSWVIVDAAKFVVFLALCQETIDHLISLLHMQDRVDQGVRVDIRSFGWHLAPDKIGTAHDQAKLQLLHTICTEDYPEYVDAIELALSHINREARESTIPQPIIRTYSPPAPPTDASNAVSSSRPAHKKRPSLINIFRSFSKAKENKRKSDTPSAAAASTSADTSPVRAKSDAGLGPFTFPVTAGENQLSPEQKAQQVARIRSKSLGSAPVDLDPPVIRHDQYKGIARTDTRDLHQGDY